MVILSENTSEPTSDGADDGTTSDGSLDHDPSTADEGDGGLVARLVSIAEQAATLIEPFATLLTAVVQAATVYALVRKA